MNLITSKYFLPNVLCLLVALLPISLLSGSLVINALHVLISIIFLFEIFKEKKFNFFKNEFFYLLLILWLSFIINLFFSSHPHSGLLRSLGFIRFILLIFAIKYILLYEKEKYIKFILNIWLFIFIIVTIDLLIEYYFGQNIFGFKSNIPGRLSGFLNDELKIGGYYLGFVLVSIATLYNNKISGKKSLFIPILIFIFVSFLIGERSNFIKLFMLVFLFSIIFYNLKLSNIIFISLFLILILYGLILKNENLKYRYLSQINFSNISKSLYFQHYESAVIIFKENPYFGVGIKNFRNEIIKEKYKSKYGVNDHWNYTPDKSKTDWDNRHIITTHPHQINFEILSETGIFGFACYLIFFILSLIKALKNYLHNKNILLLSSFLFCLIYLNPILPSGSFFTTFGATIFWMNYALMITFIKQTNK